jgi:hypothetical protein
MAVGTGPHDTTVTAGQQGQPGRGHEFRAGPAVPADQSNMARIQAGHEQAKGSFPATPRGGPLRGRNAACGGQVRWASAVMA